MAGGECRDSVNSGSRPCANRDHQARPAAAGERPACGQLGDGVPQQWPAQARGQPEAVPRAAEGKEGVGERGIGRLCDFCRCHGALTQPSHSGICLCKMHSAHPYRTASHKLRRIFTTRSFTLSTGALHLARTLLLACNSKHG